MSAPSVGLVQGQRSQDQISVFIGEQISARVVAALGLAAYLMVLKWMYRTFITVTFAYRGEFDSMMGNLDYVVCTAAVLLFAATAPLRISRPSVIVAWIVMLTVSMPGIIIGLSNPVYNVTGAKAAMALVFGQVCLNLVAPRTLRVLDFRGLAENQYVALILGLYFLLLAVSLSSTGFSGINLSFGDAYAIRDQFKGSSSGLGAYATVWFGNVLTPLVFAWGLTRKRKMFVVLGAMGAIIEYSVAGYRMIFVSFFIVLVAHYLAQSRMKYQFHAFVGAGVIGVIATNFLGGATLKGLLLERTLGVPAQLTNLYFFYYSTSPKTAWSYGMLSGLFGPPAQTPAFEIGRSFFMSNTHANANFWADGFAAFGYKGVVIATALTCLMMLLYNSASTGRRIGFTTPAIVITAMYLANASILTQSFNGGLGLLILLVTLSPKDQEPTQQQGDAAELVPVGVSA